MLHLVAHSKTSSQNAKRKRGQKEAEKEKPSPEDTEAEAEKEARKAWRKLDTKEKAVLIDSLSDVVSISHATWSTGVQ